MRQAFLILAHKNPNQVERLIDYLLKNNCFVLIHLDKKNLKAFINLKQKYISNKGVKIYSEYKVYWGSFNQIQSTSFLLRKCIENYQFDYVHLLSGQDLPLRKISQLNQFTLDAKGKDFVSIFNSSTENTWDEGGGDNRMKLYWITDYHPALEFFFSKFNVLIHLFQHTFKWYRKINFKICGGANWFSLSSKTAGLVNEFIISNVDFYFRFKNTRCADEMFLASILMKANLEANINNNNLRYVDWQSGPEYPRTFRLVDYERLNSLENIFFARKFDEKTDSFVIDKIYREILE